MAELVSSTCFCALPTAASPSDVRCQMKSVSVSLRGAEVFGCQLSMKTTGDFSCSMFECSVDMSLKVRFKQRPRHARSAGGNGFHFLCFQVQKSLPRGFRTEATARGSSQQRHAIGWKLKELNLSSSATWRDATSSSRNTTTNRIDSRSRTRSWEREKHYDYIKFLKGDERTTRGNRAIVNGRVVDIKLQSISAGDEGRGSIGCEGIGTTTRHSIGRRGRGRTRRRGGRHVEVRKEEQRETRGMVHDCGGEPHWGKSGAQTLGSITTGGCTLRRHGRLLIIRGGSDLKDDEKRRVRLAVTVDGKQAKTAKISDARPTKELLPSSVIKMRKEKEMPNNMEGEGEGNVSEPNHGGAIIVQHGDGDDDDDDDVVGDEATGSNWVDNNRVAAMFGGRTWPKRWTIVGLCFLAFLLCNMDRVNMSIAILPMAEQNHWDSTTMGLVQSSFFWGYLLTQIAGGILADRVGGKEVLGFGVIWWSIATVATPFATSLGLPALFFARVCMGIGEGVAMPAMNNLLSHWVPVNERSRSLALVYSGMYLGSVVGLAFSPHLIDNYGWPSIFYSFGSLGALWYFIWQSKAHSTPALDPTLGTAERGLLLEQSKGMQLPEKIPWKELLSKPPVWAIITCHFCHNWGTFILLTWMPTYYNQVLGFDLSESSLYCVLPWLTMAVSSNVGGWIADTMVRRGYSITVVRKVMQTIGFAGPAFFLSRVGQCQEPMTAVFCMMASQGLDAFSQSGLYCNHQDIGPRYAGFLLGLSNTAGVLAGVLGTATTGYILQHGSWDDVFQVAVSLYLVGIVIWNVFATGERVFD